MRSSFLAARMAQGSLTSDKASSLAATLSQEAQSAPASTIGLGPSLVPPKESQIWRHEIQRYYDELKKGGYKDSAIDKDVWNIQGPVELLDQIKSLPSSGPWTDDLNKLERVLLNLIDFAAVTAWALRMNGRVAALIWAQFVYS
jgi:hypothetical protein